MREHNTRFAERSTGAKRWGGRGAFLVYSSGDFAGKFHGEATVYGYAVMPTIRQFFRRSSAGCFYFALMIFGGCNVSPAPPAWNEAPSERAPAITRSSATGERHDLSVDEARGGHTLERHVGRTDAELQERLHRERDISAASTWTDRNIAEFTVAAALQAEQRRVTEWEQRGYPRANLALHFDAGKTIGRSLRHGETETQPCTRAVIVLKASGENSFYVLTTYPEARN